MEDTETLEQAIARTALNKMLKGGHFNICTIQSVAKVLRVHPEGRAYELLHTLHCIDYGDMPKEVRQAIPGLVRECLSLAPMYEFEHMKKEIVSTGSWLQRIGIGGG